MPKAACPNCLLLSFEFTVKITGTTLILVGICIGWLLCV